MEGYTWLRLGTIVALFLGSIYVLLPTVLQEDLESRLSARAEAVEAPSTDQAIDFSMAFTVAGGDPEAAAKVLEARLEAAGIAMERVSVRDGQIAVEMGVGTDRDEVIALATDPGEVRLYAANAVVTDIEPAEEPGIDASQLDPALRAVLAAADADVAFWAKELPKLVSAGMGDAAPLDLTMAFTVGETGLGGAFDAPLPEETDFVLVTLDGTLVAVAAETDAAAAVARLGADEVVDAVLVSGPLGATLAEVSEAAEVVEEAAEEVAAVEPSRVPDWFLGLLPNTRMNLGLDLQGGIDLTLQVGLDDAVLAQAARDITYFKEAAAKDGLIIDSVRRERTQPIVWVETSAELSDLQTFARRNLADYVYSETDGNKHAYEMTETRQEAVKHQAVEQVLETLRKRVDATGVKEPSIVKKGGGRINVQLPGEVDLQAAIDAIGTTAVLEFRMVDEEFDEPVLDRIIQAAKDNMPEEQFLDDALLNDWLWNTKRLAEDRLVLWEYEETTDNPVRLIPYPLKNDVVLSGNDVNDAGVTWDQNQQTYVSLEFKPRGGQIFCDITGENVGKRFAIVLDGHVMSAPNIRERICGGAARIDMGGATDPAKEAQTLALVLRTGSLDAPVDLGGVSTVGAQLGHDSIRSGTIATVIGSLIVLIFMALFYRRSGMLADIALVLNVLLVMAALATFGATLTLPGIAGIALTVGMAVDANIIIFERIREELRLGVHPRKAVDVGFEKAVVAVLDANITTAIAAVVLFSYGTGPIKGFAVTLLIGIVTTLVTALFVTRTLLDVSTRSSSARLRI